GGEPPPRTGRGRRRPAPLPPTARRPSGARRRRQRPPARRPCLRRRRRCERGGSCGSRALISYASSSGQGEWTLAWCPRSRRNAPNLRSCTVSCNERAAALAYALAAAVHILLRTPFSVARRILLVEHSETGLVGGSLTGLLHLVRGLDRTAYAPTLLLYEQKALDGALAGTDCRAMVLPAAQLGARRPARRTLDNRAGRLVRLRRHAGVVRRFVQHVMPRARALLPVLRAERPDIVHLGNSIKANLDGVVAARWARVPV